MSQVNEIKKQLKLLAKNIRKSKLDFKDKERYLYKGFEKNKIWPYRPPKEYYSALSLRESLKDEFRHKHLAKCLLFGKKYKQIEKTTRLDNFPCIKQINKYIQEISVIFNVEEYNPYTVILCETTGLPHNLEKQKTVLISSKFKINYAKKKLNQLIEEINKEEENV